MDFGAQVVQDGDRATATGRLVRNQAGDWFEPPMFVTGFGGRAVSPRAVRVAGVDFAALSNRCQAGGLVMGAATVTGIWSGDQLLAERQAPRARS